MVSLHHLTSSTHFTAPSNESRRAINATMTHSMRATPPNISSRSDQENESESERNRRKAKEFDPFQPKKLVFSPNNAAATSPKTPAPRNRRVTFGQDTIDKRSNSPGVKKVIDKNWLTPKQTPKRKSPTLSAVRFRGHSTSKKAFEVLKPVYWLNMQEATLTKWVNSILASEKTSVSTPVGTWGNSAIINLRLRRMKHVFMTENVQTPLARLYEEITANRLHIDKSINFRDDGNIRSYLINLILNNYDPHWLMCAICVIFGKQFGCRIDDAFSIANVLEDQLEAENVVYEAIRNVLTEQLFTVDFDSQQPRTSQAHEDRDYNATILYRVFAMVLLLDVSKCHRVDVIDTDPPLFRAASKMASSEDFIIEFATELMRETRNIIRVLTSKTGYHLKFKAPRLEQVYNMYTVNLVENLRDGALLAKLASIVTKDYQPLEIVRIIQNGGARQEIETACERNLCVVLFSLSGFLKAKSYEHIGKFPDPKRVLSGNRAETLKLVWQISDMYARTHLLNKKSLVDEVERQIASLREFRNAENENVPWGVKTYSPTTDMQFFMHDFSGDKQKLLIQWAGAVCAHYNCKVQEFTESFRDGVALCLLIHHYRSELINRNELCTVFSFGSTSIQDKQKQNGLVQNNFVLFENAARQLGGIPIFALSATVSTSPPFTKYKTETFGQLMYLLVAYIFRRVVHVVNIESDLDPIDSVLMRDNFPIQTTSTKIATPNQPQAMSGGVRSLFPQRKFNQGGVSPLALSSTKTLSSSPYLTSNSQKLTEQSTKTQIPTAIVLNVQSAVRCQLTASFLRKRELSALIIQRHYRTYRFRKRTYLAISRRRARREFLQRGEMGSSRLVADVRKMFSELEKRVRRTKIVFRDMKVLETTKACIDVQRVVRSRLIQISIAPVRQAGLNVIPTTTIATYASARRRPGLNNSSSRIVNSLASGQAAESIGNPTSENETSVVSERLDGSNVNPTSRINTGRAIARSIANFGTAIAGGGALLSGLYTAYQQAEAHKSDVTSVLEAGHAAYTAVVEKNLKERLKEAYQTSLGIGALIAVTKRTSQREVARVREETAFLRQVFADRDRAERTWNEFRRGDEGNDDDDSESSDNDGSNLFHGLDESMHRNSESEAAYQAADRRADNQLQALKNMFESNEMIQACSTVQRATRSLATRRSIRPMRGAGLSSSGIVVGLPGLQAAYRRAEAHKSHVASILQEGRTAYVSTMEGTQNERVKRASKRSERLACLKSALALENARDDARNEADSVLVCQVNEDEARADGVWDSFDADEEMDIGDSEDFAFDEAVKLSNESNVRYESASKGVEVELDKMFRSMKILETARACTEAQCAIRSRAIRVSIASVQQSSSVDDIGFAISRSANVLPGLHSAYQQAEKHRTNVESTLQVGYAAFSAVTEGTVRQRLAEAEEINLRNNAFVAAEERTSQQEAKRMNEEAAFMRHRLADLAQADRIWNEFSMVEPEFDDNDEQIAFESATKRNFESEHEYERASKEVEALLQSMLRNMETLGTIRACTDVQRALRSTAIQASLAPVRKACLSLTPTATTASHTSKRRPGFSAAAFKMETAAGSNANPAASIETENAITRAVESIGVAIRAGSSSLPGLHDAYQRAQEHKSEVTSILEAGHATYSAAIEGTLKEREKQASQLTKHLSFSRSKFDIRNARDDACNEEDSLLMRQVKDDEERAERVWKSFDRDDEMDSTDFEGFAFDNAAKLNEESDVRYEKASNRVNKELAKMEVLYKNRETRLSCMNIQRMVRKRGFGLNAMVMALVIVKACFERNSQRRHVVHALGILEQLTRTKRNVTRFVEIGYSFDVIVNCMSNAIDIESVLEPCLVLLERMCSEQENRTKLAIRTNANMLLRQLTRSVMVWEAKMMETERRAERSVKTMNEVRKRGIYIREEANTKSSIPDRFSKEVRTMWRRLIEVRRKLI